MKLNVTDLEKVEGFKVINEGNNTECFKSVTIDSRNCRRGDLFFAIKGDRFDGHDFIDEVCKKGVRCGVVNKAWYKRLSESKKRSFKKFSFAVVNDTAKSLGTLAKYYRKKFIIPVIAVGGSNGKTSAKDYIANVLSQKYKVLKTEGNLNNQYGVPLTLFKLNAGHEIAVIEIGTNTPGEIERLSGITAPQYGLLTNIGKEHLELLKNLDGVAKEECALIDYLDKNYGMFFLNADDKILAAETKKRRVNTFTYGSGGKADVKGRIHGFRGFSPEVEVRYGSAGLKAILKGIGKQSYYAALAAAAAGFYFEVPAGKIKKAISGYSIESGKRNQLKKINGIWIIDDSYNSNPDSVNAALENLKEYKIDGNKIIVLGDMLELGKTSRREHFETGKLVKKMGFKNLYTFGKDSVHTFYGAKGIKNNFYFSDKSVLADMLRLNVKKGDLVLVKGSRGMKMESIIESLVS
jgi:UDP-N-acetylmuramoyl-tripeptide--D-alanyl-D-alanine ligase